MLLSILKRIHLEDAYEGTVDEACRELKEKTECPGAADHSSESRACKRIKWDV